MKPVIGITMGDPAGIGSEITVKMFLNEDVYSMCIPVVIGSKVAMESIKNILKQDDLEIHCVKDTSECKQEKWVINLIDLDNLKEDELKYGVVSATAGKAAGEYITRAIDMALDGKIDAIVTNPIHKESFKLGGYGIKYAGHTEMLADLTKTKNYAMMLAAGCLRVIHVSTHVSLRQALEAVKKNRIIEVIQIANEACISLGIPTPRIAVAGLNPHSGEGGLFGDEEIEEIIPAIEEANASGLNVIGPVPADTIFSKVLGGIFDIVVCMYHDQGHIPTKTVGFKWDRESNEWGQMNGVNITLGLPVIRASVDHGTAFGKAGKGIADATSLFDALQYGITMAENKK